MAGDDTRLADRSQGSAAPERLDSWKEIAAYLKRDVTTVRRWEKREGLPVHRHLHAQRDSVYAYKTDLDTWWQGRRNRLASNGVVEGTPEGPQPVPWLSRARLAWVLVATFVAVTGILANVLLGRGRSEALRDKPQVRFSILPPAGTSFGGVSLSPDGRRLAFTAAPASGGGKALLWIRPLDALMAHALPDTEDAMLPFWSPSSDAVGFFAGGKLWVVPASGGSPRVVCAAPNGRGGSWNRAGTIVFAPTGAGGLFRVPAAGGAATPITSVEAPDERGHVWPEFLPDGQHFLYLVNGNGNAIELHHLMVGSLDGAAPRRLLPLASNAAYTPEGFLIFERDRQLLAQGFDARRLELTGDPVTLAESVHMPLALDHKADFSVSTNGVLVYRAMQSPATRLVWRDRTAPPSALIAKPAEHYDPVLSPDGTRVAMAIFDPRLSKRFGFGVLGVRSDIWTVDLSTGTAAQVTTDPTADWGPVWSPDGRRIVFSSHRSGTLELYQKDLSSGAEVRLPSTGRHPVAQSWSPDGQRLVYSAFDAATRMDLWLLPMTGAQAPVPLLRTAFSEDQAQVSPDGRWLAYSSNESGQSEVYVQGFPAPGAKWRVSTNGGGDPRWRPDGTELYYVSEDRRLMAVGVTSGAGFEHRRAVPQFDTGAPPGWYSARNLYDVGRDGRYLFMAPIEDDRSMPFAVVVNWTAQLGR